MYGESWIPQSATVLSWFPVFYSALTAHRRMVRLCMDTFATIEGSNGFVCLVLLCSLPSGDPLAEVHHRWLPRIGFRNVHQVRPRFHQVTFPSLDHRKGPMGVIGERLRRTE